MCKVVILYNSNRGVAQVVAHQTGGLGVASSSLVTPTKKRGSKNESFYCLFCDKMLYILRFMHYAFLRPDFPIQCIILFCP